MTDLLIGVAVLAGMALFVYAIVRAGRQQRRRRGDVFRAFAESRGWEYAAEGDPSLHPVLQPFAGIREHTSPSLGEVAPRNVVAGTLEEARVWVFWQTRRVTEGDTLQFYTCLLAGSEFGADGLIVRFEQGRSVSSSVDSYYTGRRERVRVGASELRVFEAEPGSARQLLSGALGRSLAGAVERLPWPVDLQVRRDALALYTIDRNLELTEPAQLALLTDVTLNVARILAGDRS